MAGDYYGIPYLLILASKKISFPRNAVMHEMSDAGTGSSVTSAGSMSVSLTQLFGKQACPAEKCPDVRRGPAHLIQAAKDVPHAHGQRRHRGQVAEDPRHQPGSAVVILLGAASLGARGGDKAIAHEPSESVVTHCPPFSCATGAPPRAMLHARGQVARVVGNGGTASKRPIDGLGMCPPLRSRGGRAPQQARPGLQGPPAPPAAAAQSRRAGT
jgi:hypothetical protein